MSGIMEDIAFLSQEIGPRPAGTEEEQQAALYIADQMQKRTGFTANIEDFNTMVHPGIVEALCFGVSAFISLLAIFFNVLVVPAFLLTLICAVLYAFELMDRPVLSRLFERGVSQNVVSRYVPGTASEARNRKIILVANYDSSKVQAELNGSLFGIYPALLKASAIGLLALPLIWLIRSLFLLHATGPAVIFFNILALVALVAALVPVVLFVLHRSATYNEAANNNAAGVATLLEVARRISEGSYSEEELAARESEHLHSAEEALAAGVVPEGADLSYETASEHTEEERLASAKAAVAALTGQPLREYQVEKIDFTPLSEREDIDSYVEMDYGEYAYREEDDPEATQQLPAFDEYTPHPVTHRDATPAAAAEAEPQEFTPAVVVEENTSFAPVANEPSWFTTGRAKAVKPEGADNVPIRRSRYADALDAAVAASKEHFDEAARMLDEGTIERISEMQRGLERETSTAGVRYDASLQEILSDEAEEAAPAQEPESPLASSDAEESFAEEPVAEETGAAALSAEESAMEAAPDKTTAMEPIDVFSLADEAEPPAPEQDSIHDFGEISPAPARNFQSVTLASLGLDEDEDEGPARYSNPLKSERIPRITFDSTPTASVIQDEIVETPQQGAAATPEQSIEEKRAALRNAIPSLSGEFAPIVVDEEPQEAPESDAFSAPDTAAVFDPVGEEIASDLAPEERYIDDVDDATYEEAAGEASAAASGYVEMPESRLGRFFNRFRKKPEAETSTSEWLDVDENFDAREVGAARGSWESFREDDTSAASAQDADLAASSPASGEDDAYMDANEEDTRPWNGGAFSQLRARLSKGDEAEEDAGEVDALVEDELAASSAEDADVEERRGPLAVPAVDLAAAERISEETKLIYSFRNPDVNTEVWFVALGSEYADNNGMKAFLAEHASELRGAIIVNLEAMGAGTLSFVEEEGKLTKAKPSSRLKRYLRKASEATGLHVESISLPWRESSASFAIKRGLQAMTLAGIEGGKPAYLGQGDDVVENIDEQIVEENARLVLEFIKSI